MPTKSRSDTWKAVGTGWYTSGELFEYSVPTSYDLPTPTEPQIRNSTIIYENSNRTKPNECHQEISSTPSKEYLKDCLASGAIPDWDYAWASQYPWIIDLHHHSNVGWVPNYPWSSARSQLLETDYSLDELIVERLAALEFGMQSKIFSLPRAIIELKDVPQTVKQLWGLGSWVQRLGRDIRARNMTHWGTLPSRIKNMTWLEWEAHMRNESVAAMASLYLMTEFGVKPTAADIDAFIGKPRKDGRPWKLVSRPITLVKGQKLEVPFSLAPPESAFPKLVDINFTQTISLLRDYHSSNGIREKVYGTMRGNAYRAETHSGCLFGEVAHVPKRSDWNYGEMLAYSGGGPFATAWELTPYTWLSDSMLDLGKTIAQWERQALPVELKPTLRWGSWISHRKSVTTFLPQYRSMGYSYKLCTIPDPGSGYGGAALVIGRMKSLGYKPASHGELEYKRYQLSGVFKNTSVPTLKCPSGYILGATAMVLAQFATSHEITKVRSMQ